MKHPREHETLIAAGYEVAAPGPVAGEIDARACARARCPQCGHQGMDYVPYSKPGSKPESYRAFARCPQCGHEYEF